MHGRKPAPFMLKAHDDRALRQLLRDGDLPQRVARRARILLARARGERIEQVVVKVEQDRATIWRVCQRYAEKGLGAALYDAPRSGRPRVFFASGAQTD
jgi:winged helix-turn helix protein